MKGEKNMPLTLFPSGKETTIKKIGGKDDTKRFLSSLGFVPGEFVKVVAENCGNMIVCVKDTRVALDKELARRIVV